MMPKCDKAGHDGLLHLVTNTNDHIDSRVFTLDAQAKEPLSGDLYGVEELADVFVCAKSTYHPPNAGFEAVELRWAGWQAGRLALAGLVLAGWPWLAGPGWSWPVEEEVGERSKTCMECKRFLKAGSNTDMFFC